MIEVISDPGYVSIVDGEVYTVFYVKLEDIGPIEAEEAMEVTLQGMQFTRSFKCSQCGKNTSCVRCSND